MEKLTLYHGSPDEIIIPTYGRGNEKHDYGNGFYLTENIDYESLFRSLSK